MQYNAEKLKDKIVNSKLVRKAYRILFYYEQGKGQLNRFYSFLPDVIIILGGVKYLLGVDLTRNQVIIITLSAMIGFTFIGYVIKRLGLYDTDMKVKANQDPVMHEMYEAAKKINGGEIYERKKNR